jgi:hypothetical protein
MEEEMGTAGRKAFAPAWLAAIALAGFWLALGVLVAPMAQRHDFLAFHTGAVMAHQGAWARLYDAEAQNAVQGQTLLVPYIKPPVFAWALQALGPMSVRQAYLLWLGLGMALLAALWGWAWRRFGETGLLWCALSAPAALGLMHGQDTAWMLWAMTAGLLLAGRGRDFAAGAAWSLLLMKFHLCLGVPVLLAVQRRWRRLGGLVAGGAVVAVASLGLVGQEGARQYARLLTDPTIARLNPAWQKMPNLRGLGSLVGLDGGHWLAAAAVVVLALVALAARRADLWTGSAAAVAAGVLIAPHSYLYDLALLLPGQILLASDKGRSPEKMLSALLAMPAIVGLGLLNPPWSAVPALLLLAFVGTMAFKRRQTSASRKLAPAGVETPKISATV